MGIYPPFGVVRAGEEQVSWRSQTEEYVFLGAGVEYRLDLKDAAVQRGLLRLRARIGDSSFFYPVIEAGTRYRDGEGKLLEPWEFAALASVRLLSHHHQRGQVSLEFEETYQGSVSRKTYSLWLAGRSLVVRVQAEGTSHKNNYAGFAFGPGEATPGVRIIDLPYAVCPIVAFEGGRFYSTYLDWSESTSLYFHRRAWYWNPASAMGCIVSENAADTAGKVPPLHELAYITISDNPLDCLPRILNPSSPYRALLNDKVVVDWWWLEGALLQAGIAPRLKASRALLDLYHESGMRDIAIIYHVWQHYGYDAGLPAHYPVNPAFGSDDDLRALIETAVSAGGLFALHENYRDMYPHNPPEFPSPHFDQEALAHDCEGKPVLGWYNPFTKQQAFMLAADRALEFAAQQGRLIRSHYRPNATFLDITPAWQPAAQFGLGLDLRASNPTPKTFAEGIRLARELFQQHRAIYQGPLFGEGGEGPYRFDTFFAGLVDGVERQTEGRSLAFIIPDYELLAVKPLMANHGMGYYSRYFVRTGQADLPSSDGLESFFDLGLSLAQQWDVYRASEIAFNHAGFISDGAPFSQQFLEYYLLQQLQSLYLAGSPTSIAYYQGKKRLALGQALAQDYDFLNSRLHISYDNGLQLFLNHDSGARDSEKDFSFQQGRFGWHYQEWEGNAFRDMTFDWERFMWKGTAPWCLIFPHGAHPSSSTIPVRTWVAPRAGKVRIYGRAADLDSGGGDGVQVRILKGEEQLWSHSIENGDRRGVEFDLQEKVEVGERLHFLVHARGEENYDSTRFIITLSYLPDSLPPWEVAGPKGEKYLLPANGWLAWTEDGKFLEFSALVEGKRADYVRSPAYLFANARGGGWRKIRDISTDGLAAVVPGRFGRDLHLLGARGVALEGDIIRLSAAADLNLLYQEGPGAILQAHNLVQSKTAEITYYDLPRAWRDKGGRPRPDLVICPLEEANQPGPPLAWTSPSGKEIRFSIEANIRYAIS